MPTATKAVTPAEGYVLDAEGNLVPDYDSTMVDLKDHKVVSGTVVRIDRDEVLVDVGYKSEGVITMKELSIRSTVDPHDIVAIGDEIEVLVMTTEDTEGRLILSKKRAEYEKAWQRIEALSESQDNVAGQVIEVVKGGLILDIGLRGFLPASLVDLRRVRDLHEFLGRELECKIIEMDRNRNNVVLSRRAVLETERRDQRENILGRLEKGVRVHGKISSIVAFGAFVDLDGIDGLIHISELSWEHVEHPSQVVQVGQDVEVMVVEVDKDRQRISLSLRLTENDPWQEAVTNFDVGTVAEGTVTKLVPFGAFVDIGHGVEGLVHISEFSDEHIATPDEMLAKGQKVNIKVIDIDQERRRVSLSIKQAVEGWEPKAKKRRPSDEEGEEGEESEADEESAVEADEAEAAAETTEESAEESAEESEEK